MDLDKLVNLINQIVDYSNIQIHLYKHILKKAQLWNVTFFRGLYTVIKVQQGYLTSIFLSFFNPVPFLFHPYAYLLFCFRLFTAPFL